MDAATDFATRLDRHLAHVSRRRGPLGTPQVAVRAPGLGIDDRFGDATLPDLVHRRVLAPLGLQRTFVPCRSSPARGTTDLAPLYLAPWLRGRPRLQV